VSAYASVRLQKSAIFFTGVSTALRCFVLALLMLRGAVSFSPLLRRRQRFRFYASRRCRCRMLYVFRHAAAEGASCQTD